MRIHLTAFLVLALSVAAARAQDDGAPATEPPSAMEPAPLVPSASPEPVPSPDQIVVPAAPSVLGERAPGAVEVGALGTLEGPVAGTLSDADGGLGGREWNGVGRAAAIATLTGLPESPSPTVRLLLRKLLLTVAPPPEGRAEAPFNAVRIRKLLDAGLVGDAAALAAQVRAPKDVATSRLQADTLLLAGDDANACGDATAFRLDSDEQFWIELRAYCYALAKDPALDLTRAVLGGADPAFNALLDGAIAGRPRAGVALAHPTSLHVRLMQRLKLPMNQGVLELGMPGAVIAVRSAATPKPVRIAAAERVLRAGALPPALLAQVLDLFAFKPGDLATAVAMAPSEPPLLALARLRAALKRETDPERRAELLYTAFRVGEDNGILFGIAPAFAADAAALVPVPDWAGWGSAFVHAFLAAGRPDAAEHWVTIVRQSPLSPDEPIIALALALSDAAHVEAAQPALADLSQRSLADPEGSSAHAALIFGLFDALALPMPPEAEVRIQPLVAQRWPGRRPTDDAMRRTEAASLHDRRGEVVLGVLAALGRGPGDLAPDVTVRLVRALQTAGVRDAAHALVAEAVLTR